MLVLLQARPPATAGVPDPELDAYAVVECPGCGYKKELLVNAAPVLNLVVLGVGTVEAAMPHLSAEDRALLVSVSPVECPHLLRRFLARRLGLVRA